MIRALWTSASGMMAQQLNTDVIANNLANVNTTGFKASRADFQDLLYQTIRPAGTSNTSGTQMPVGIQVGHGTRTIAIQKIFTQGDYEETGNPFDMVIEGDGFFQIALPDGSTAYTRAGSFKLDSMGRLVTSDGFLMKDQITIPQEAQDVTITSDGTVQALMPGQTLPQQLGVIELARFPNPAGLSSIGHNLYIATASSGTPITGTPGSNGLGTIVQRSLEMSNVKVVEEMVNLIVAQRAYEINSKAIQTADEMLGIANNLRR